MKDLSVRKLRIYGHNLSEVEKKRGILTNCWVSVSHRSIISTLYWSLTQELSGTL